MPQLPYLRLPGASPKTPRSAKKTQPGTRQDIPLAQPHTPLPVTPASTGRERRHLPLTHTTSAPLLSLAKSRSTGQFEPEHDKPPLTPSVFFPHQPAVERQISVPLAPHGSLVNRQSSALSSVASRTKSAALYRWSSKPRCVILTALGVVMVFLLLVAALHALSSDDLRVEVVLNNQMSMVGQGESNLSSVESVPLEIDIQGSLAPTDVVVFRILRDELPGFEKPGWVPRWLQVTLETEQRSDNVTTVWILHRIVDASMEEKLLEILANHSQTFAHIPFDPDQFRGFQLRFQGLVEHGVPLDHLTSMEYAVAGLDQQIDAWMTVFRSHENYLLNTNAVRQAAVAKAQEMGARWVGVWDVGTNVGKGQWAKLLATTANANITQYVELPQKPTPFPPQTPQNVMRGKRAAANTLDQDLPTPTPPPTLLIQVAAEHQPNPEISIGCVRQDADLPTRLGLKGKWLTEARSYGEASRSPWSFRLPTVTRGPMLTRADPVIGGLKRDWMRHGMHVSCAHRRLGHRALVERALGVSYAAQSGLNRNTLLAYNERVLKADKKTLANPASGNRRLHHLVSELVHCADKALVGPLYSVMNKTESPSRDLHDYFSIKPYWWPDPTSLTGYQQRDGERRPDSFLWAEGSERFDRSRMQSLYGNVTCLAMANYFTPKRKYVDRGAELVRYWFLNPATRMNPSIEFAQWKPGPTASHSAIVDLIPFYHLLDAIRLIGRSGSLTANEMEDMRQWCRDLLQSMHRTHQDEAYFHRNNIGVYYDLISSSLHAFVGDINKVVVQMLLARGRMMGQVSWDGQLFNEMDRRDWRHYTMYALQAWYNLASFADLTGVEIWPTTLPNRPIPLLCWAAYQNTPYFGFMEQATTTPVGSSDLESEVDPARYQPIYHLATRHCPGLREVEPGENSMLLPRVPALYASNSFLDLPIYGAMPAWQLGRTVPTESGQSDPDVADTWATVMREEMREHSVPIAQVHTCTFMCGSWGLFGLAISGGMVLLTLAAMGARKLMKRRAMEGWYQQLAGSLDHS